MKAALSAVLALVASSFSVRASDPADARAATPAYRGEFYAFDAYPHGYKGYPAFPYYGAPFGYGGPAFAATEQTVTVSDKANAARRLQHRAHRSYRTTR